MTDAIRDRVPKKKRPHARPSRVRRWLLWYRVARDGNTDWRTSASWAWERAKEGKAPYE